METKFLSAALAIFGAGLVGVGQALVVKQSIKSIGEQPEAADKINSAMLVGLSLIETSGIYCFVIAILILFAK